MNDAGGTAPEAPCLPKFRDVLIVGAGPAGLIAATYLCRFRRSVWLVDDGDSRAARIPRSLNIPGFPLGIRGAVLLQELRHQAERAGAIVTRGRIEQLCAERVAFRATTADGRMFGARKVILTTGLRDAQTVPGISPRALWNPSVRWCPVCDGYEALDRRVVLVTNAEHALGHSRFIRTYTRSLTLVLVPGERDALSRDAIAALGNLGVNHVAGALEDMSIRDSGGGELRLAGGRVLPFEVLYLMVGSEARSHLAQGLGARCGSGGAVQVDAHQRTSVRGLYAAGDLVASLHQVSVAAGQATIAASAVHAELPPNPR